MLEPGLNWALLLVSGFLRWNQGSNLSIRVLALEPGSTGSVRVVIVVVVVGVVVCLDIIITIIQQSSGVHSKVVGSRTRFQQQCYNRFQQ